jgi:hypothetical protein
MSIVSNDTLAAEQNQAEDAWDDDAMDTWKLVARFAWNFMRVSPRPRLNWSRNGRSCAALDSELGGLASVCGCRYA